MNPHKRAHGILIMAAVFLLLAPPMVWAQPQTPASGGKSPIEITALKSLEWLRNQKQFIAREQVVVKQGEATIRADLLIADYVEPAQGGMEITRLTATGGVEIESNGSIARGDKAVYDVATEIATLTGDELTITSPDQVVSAKDSLEYNVQTRTARAIGAAKVVRGEDTLSADVITAIFEEDQQETTPPQNQSVGGGDIGALNRLEAKGKVIITTPQEVLRGNEALYNAKTNKAEIKGDVIITRGPNRLEGARAEVDLTTNISRMFGSDAKDGRVRGVFYPATAPRGDNAP